MFGGNNPVSNHVWPNIKRSSGTARTRSSRSTLLRWVNLHHPDSAKVSYATVMSLLLALLLRRDAYDVTHWAKHSPACVLVIAKDDAANS